MDAEEARSDLLVAGAAFVLGHAILATLQQIVPLRGIPGVSVVWALVVPLLITVLAPYLLMRYRGEPWGVYGLTGSSVGALGPGALLGLPLVLAAALATASEGGGVLEAFPLAVTSPDDALRLLGRLAPLCGLALLGAYLAVKARDAFRGVPRALPTVVTEVGRIVALVAAVAGGLVVVGELVEGAPFDALAVVLPAFGVAGMVGLAMRERPRPATTTRPVLVTPTVLFALAGFILFPAEDFLSLVYQAALLAGVGLSVGLLQETRRSAFAALGLALVVALLSDFG